MPRYFIDSVRGSRLQADTEGLVFRDDLSARDHAMAMLLELARVITVGEHEAALAAVVRSADGQHLCTVRMS
ncbi:DUF6894 family protein, partial [Methylobacterium nigriterrae]|uniref:DUF6894 family protein n=1 Tax=Methylobacterium nigriterrae TaxID=3127512 RepID=UPI0030138171